jgi:undecaprenyl-diphosphatase
MLAFAVRLGSLFAVLMGCSGQIRHMMRQNRISQRSNRRRRYVDTGAMLDLRLLRTASIPALISVFFYQQVGRWIQSPLWLALSLLLGGFLLFWPRVLPQGNKNGRSASRLDGIVIGLGSTLAVIPGFSRIGCSYSFGLVQGMERSYALEMSILLSVPVLLGLTALDLIALIAAKATISGGIMLWALICGAISFLGGYLSLTLIRHACARAPLSGYSYYAWGMALLIFVLYLTI